MSARESDQQPEEIERLIDAAVTAWKGVVSGELDRSEVLGAIAPLLARLRVSFHELMVYVKDFAIEEERRQREAMRRN